MACWGPAGTPGRQAVWAVTAAGWSECGPALSGRGRLAPGLVPVGSENHKYISHYSASQQRGNTTKT